MARDPSIDRAYSLDSAATADHVRRVVEAVQSLGFQAHPIPGAQRTAISVTGNRGSVESASFENLPGVAEVIPVTAPYKLVSREAKAIPDYLQRRSGPLRRGKAQVRQPGGVSKRTAYRLAEQDLARLVRFGRRVTIPAEEVDRVRLEGARENGKKGGRPAKKREAKLEGL